MEAPKKDVTGRVNLQGVAEPKPHKENERRVIIAGERGVGLRTILAFPLFGTQGRKVVRFDAAGPSNKCLFSTLSGI